MKPLDLNKPIQTRNGRPVRILATDLKGARPIAAAVPSGVDGTENVTKHYKNGQFTGAHETAHDLVNVVKRTERFCNVYDKATACPAWYTTKAQCDVVGAKSDKKGVVKATFEDGELVSVEIVKDD